MAQATNELTPMRRQYQQIKDQHKDCILMFRLGDFYEMFDEDAKLTARELDLTLTTRDRGKPKEEQTPMCGVPYHSVDSYIARLVQKGYKVAICEQMEDPATAKGLVQRDITRIITQKQLHRLHLRRKRKIRPCLLRRFHRRVLHHGLLRRPERGLRAWPLRTQRNPPLRCQCGLRGH